MIFLGNFDYKAFVRAQTIVVLRDSEIIGPFHLSPRYGARALVIISISINNANLFLRGIILGNDFRKRISLHCRSTRAHGWERFVRARRRLHRASRQIDDRSRSGDGSLVKVKSARSMAVISPVTYSTKVCHNLSFFFLFFYQFSYLFALLIFQRLNFALLSMISHQRYNFLYDPICKFVFIIRFLDSCIQALLSKYPFVKFHFIDYLLDRPISFYKRGKKSSRVSYSKVQIISHGLASLFFRTRRCFFHERMQ